MRSQAIAGVVLLAGRKRQRRGRQIGLRLRRRRCAPAPKSKFACPVSLNAEPPAAGSDIGPLAISGNEGKTATKKIGLRGFPARIVAKVWSGSKKQAGMRLSLYAALRAANRSGAPDRRNLQPRDAPAAQYDFHCGNHALAASRRNSPRCVFATHGASLRENQLNIAGRQPLRGVQLLIFTYSPGASPRAFNLPAPGIRDLTVFGA